ncbi:MAG TPA: methyltransferase [Mycobacteriales bacterium]|nr:methyltransferase [Mycobacteriales bacterium]
MAELARGRRPSARERLADDRSPRATVARLFLLGDDVALDDVADVVALDDVAPLLSTQSGVARAAYDVSPYADDTHDWWVVSDRTAASGRPARADHVLGVGRASTTLAQLTVRRPVRSALDVGTGCGVQSLHLSTHADRVTATDVVDRAVQLAATSFALSGVDVELLTGDLVGPVRDRAFDLVVCNPPFVVGPDARFAYRDADWSSSPEQEADALSRRAVRAAAEVLGDGGVAQLLVNWLHVRGEDWRERVAGWVGDLGVDALLLERDTQDPAGYVDTWLADAGESDDEERAEQWRRWLVARGVEAVGFGWVVLRRGPGPHRVAVERVVQEVEQPLGEQIGRWLDRLSWLRDTADPELLDARLRVADGVRLESWSRPGTDGWDTELQRLVGGGGFHWSVECDEAVAALVAGCDGSRPVAELVAVLSAATAMPSAELAAAVCGALRPLVERGILEPAARQT